MHVHLPKPLHGWRAFVGEVGIIVLGVLIALGFEQLVEQWHWGREVATTRQALANELVANAEQGAERISVENCLRDRIGELALRLRQSSGRWTADPMPVGQAAKPSPHWDNRAMGRVYAVPLRGWSQDAWDTAKTSGVFDHMSRNEVGSYSAVYAEIAGIRELQSNELLTESKLSFLSTDQQLESGTRSEALQALGQLDALNSTTAGLSSLIVAQVGDLHLDVDRAATAEAMKRTVQNERTYRGACVKDVRLQF